MPQVPCILLEDTFGGKVLAMPFVGNSTTTALQ
jgi:hypothetical protein